MEAHQLLKMKLGSAFVVVALVVFACIAYPTQLAYAAQTADGFVYEVGDWIDGGTVRQGSPESAGYKVTREGYYGCSFGWEYSPDIEGWNGASGGTAQDCGYGVYITEYVGSSSSIKIPDKIDGKNVVYASIDFKSMDADADALVQSIDVRGCTSLKCLEAYCPSTLLVDGSNESLVHLYIQSAYDIARLDLTGATNLELFYCLGYFPRDFSLSVANLRYLGATVAGLNRLNLSGASKLEVLELHQAAGVHDETLNLTGCTSLRSILLGGGALTSFDIAAFPQLQTLYLPDNCLSASTVAQLKSQCAARGIDFEADDQFTTARSLPQNISLSNTSFTYDGNKKEPAVTVPGLVENEDYWVYYENNVSVGVGKAIILGLGSYRGKSITKTFSIVAPTSSSSGATTGESSGASSAKTSLAKASVTVKSKTWTGKALKPAAPVVKLGGKTLRNGVDYTWSCKGGKAVGSYKVSVTGKGAYAGTKTATFKILPKGTGVSKLSKAKKAFTVKWKALSKAALKQVTGYQVRWSTSKKFTAKTTKTKTVKAASAAGKKRTLKVAKLKAKKTYYVQVRTYKKVSGKTYCSSWSKAVKVKTK